MQNKQKHLARRKLLRVIVTGGGVFATSQVLPNVWTKPIVEGVVLPAHAKSSPDPFDGLFETGSLSTTSLRNMNPAYLYASADSPGSVLDFFISPVEASVPCINVSALRIFVSGSTADVCLNFGIGNAAQGSTSVDQNTGKLGDIPSIGGTGIDLSNMQVSSNGSKVTGLATGSGCGPFTAPRIDGSYVCENVTARLTLSAPRPA